MKILHICNYPAWDNVSQGRQPSHHLFGIHQMVDKYEKQGNHTVRGYIKAEYGGGYVDSVIVDETRLTISKVFKLLWVLILSFRYDVVYDTINCVSKELGLLMRLSPCKLVTILHHPPFQKQLKYSYSDAYIVFDEVYAKLIHEIDPQKNVFVNKWIPDFNWYKDYVPDCTSYQYDFIDNGKTCRDHRMLLAAIYKLGATLILVNRRENLPSNFIEGKGVDFVEQKIHSDIKMGEYIQKCKCIIIPIVKKEIVIGPLGITSFMDALALHKPVICSDNTCFAKTVEKESLGLVYKTGDFDDLYRALTKMYGDESFRKKCIDNNTNYTGGMDIQQYADNLYKILKTIL